MTAVKMSARSNLRDD